MEQNTHPGAYRFSGSPSDSSSSSDAPSNASPDDGTTGSSSNTPPPIASNDTSSADGIGSVEGSNGGVGINAGDTDGDGDGLINANTNVGGLLGGTLDGVQVDAVNSGSLLDAHAPGLLDATVGDGSVAGVVDGVTGDGLGGIVSGLTGATDGFQGVQIDALDGTNIAEVNAPGVADATVGGAELGNLLDGGGSLLGELTDGIGSGSSGIEVDALNGDNLAEAHAPGVADATVGGAELGNILGGAELGGLLGGADLPLDLGGLTGDLNIDVAGLDIGQALDNVTT
ncbi:hypothetical protein GIW81_07085 [Hyphomicrobium sp. xq]|uniref:Uncharacterized protein n=1 Tax=Hyphomicrobium album TaxID=2665159 RepID=A0A6I3KN33_9HYPH|nr:hypothetical protein [Hyphomicrobium album]MTD94101.1 hypothetical protein [Hyphomicrobium album]